MIGSHEYAQVGGYNSNAQRQTMSVVRVANGFIVTAMVPMTIDQDRMQPAPDKASVAALKFMDAALDKERFEDDKKVKEARKQLSEAVRQIEEPRLPQISHVMLEPVTVVVKTIAELVEITKHYAETGFIKV
jgi:hypothetical protein